MTDAEMDRMFEATFRKTPNRTARAVFGRVTVLARAFVELTAPPHMTGRGAWSIRDQDMLRDAGYSDQPEEMVRMVLAADPLVHPALLPWPVIRNA